MSKQEKGTRRRGLAARLPRSVVLLTVMASPAAQSGPATVEARVRYYEQKIAEDPGHYPSHALLSAALLDLARDGLDPEAVGRARQAAQRSLKLQVNYEALKTAAAVENFAHRFDSALEFARRARTAYPEDTELLTLQVEARVGQGRLEEAKVLLEPLRGTAPDFHTAAARAVYFAASDQVEEAVAAYLAAAELASRQRATELQAWALAQSTAVLMDRGIQLERAARLLERAREASPGNRILRVHEAELAAARGDPGRAVELGLELLRERDTPEVHALLADWNRTLGRTEEARTHFLAAESVYRRAAEAGEQYTLVALANLYCHAGERLPEAGRFLRTAREAGQAGRHVESASRCLDGRE